MLKENKSVEINLIEGLNAETPSTYVCLTQAVHTYVCLSKQLKIKFIRSYSSDHLFDSLMFIKINFKNIPTIKLRTRILFSK